MALLQAGNDLAELMRDLGRHRIEQPTDDVTSALVNAEIDGERLTPDELASFFIPARGRGQRDHPQRDQLGIQLISEHPEQRAAWLADLEA